MGNKHTNKINSHYLQLEINYLNKLLSFKNSQLLEHIAIGDCFTADIVLIMFCKQIHRAIVNGKSTYPTFITCIIAQCDSVNSLITRQIKKKFSAYVSSINVIWTCYLPYYWMEPSKLSFL